MKVIEGIEARRYRVTVEHHGRKGGRRRKGCGSDAAFKPVKKTLSSPQRPSAFNETMPTAHVPADTRNIEESPGRGGKGATQFNKRKKEKKRSERSTEEVNIFFWVIQNLSEGFFPQWLYKESYCVYI